MSAAVPRPVPAPDRLAASDLGLPEALGMVGLADLVALSLALDGAIAAGQEASAMDRGLSASVIIDEGEVVVAYSIPCRRDEGREDVA